MIGVGIKKVSGGIAFIRKSDGVELLKITTAGVDVVIGGTDIASGAVSAAKLATDAVETLKIKDANVTAPKLATDAVETAKIKDEAVTLVKLAGEVTDAIEAAAGGLVLAGAPTAVKGWSSMNTQTSGGGSAVCDLSTQLSNIVNAVVVQTHNGGAERAVLTIEKNAPIAGKVTVRAYGIDDGAALGGVDFEVVAFGDLVA
jgi:hypothetical protein